MSWGGSKKRIVGFNSRFNQYALIVIWRRSVRKCWAKEPKKTPQWCKLFKNVYIVTFVYFHRCFFFLPRLYWVSALWDHSSLDTWHAPVHRRKLHALCNQSIKEYNLVWFALTPCLFSRWAVVVLKRTSGQFTECKKILNKGWWVSVPLILRPAADFTKRWDSSYLELGWVTRTNLGLILRSACVQCRVGTRPKS